MVGILVGKKILSPEDVLDLRFFLLGRVFEFLADLGNLIQDLLFLAVGVGAPVVAELLDGALLLGVALLCMLEVTTF